MIPYSIMLIHLRVDLSHASANLSPSQCREYGHLPADATLEQEEDFHASLNAQWGPDFPNGLVIAFPGMDTLMSSLFHRVRQLSVCASSMNIAIIDPILQQKLTKNLLLLERQVNASIWSPCLNRIRQQGSRTPLQEAVRICSCTWHSAILVYIHVTLRRTPISSRVVQKLVKRTRDELGTLSEDELWVRFPYDFLLWVCILVGAAAVEEEDKNWLCKLFVRLRKGQEAGLRRWEDAKKVLMRFAWVEHLCERPCRGFWEMAERTSRGENKSDE